jgi:hypothetical protein
MQGTSGQVAGVVAPPLGRDASTGPTLLLRFRDEFSYEVSATPLTAEAASLIEKETLGDQVLMVS